MKISQKVGIAILIGGVSVFVIAKAVRSSQNNPPPPPPPPGSNTLWGHVYANGNTSMPVASALVGLGGLYVTTDSQGYFEFTDIAAGTYSLTCVMTGFDNYSVSVVVPEGDKEVNISLNQTQSTSAFDILLTGNTRVNAGGYWFSADLTYNISNPSSNTVTHTLKLYRRRITDGYTAAVELTNSDYTAVIPPGQPSPITITLAPGASVQYRWTGYYMNKMTLLYGYQDTYIPSNGLWQYWLRDELGNESAKVTN
jgi:hypothetical protein